MPGNRVTQPVKGQRGEQGYSIKSASLVGDNLVLQSTSGATYDVGSVKGANGASGSDISDPNEPDILVDNFLSQGDGNTSGGFVMVYSTDGEGLLHTNSKTLSSNALIQAYEGDSETDHIGIVQLRCDNTFVGDTSLYTIGRENANIIDFSSLNTLYVVMKTPNNTTAPIGHSLSTSTNYDIYVGFFSDGTAPPTDGIYFRRLNGASWTPVCKTGASTTTGTTTAYANNTWYTLRIRKLSATQVGFTINGGTEVIISTNIPTSYLNCGIMVKNNTVDSAVRYIKLDFFSLKIGTSTATTLNTIVGTANEVEVTGPLNNIITIGLPDSILVPTINTSQLNFNTSPATPTNTIGGLYWDTSYKTISLGLTTNVQLKLGQGLYKYVKNTSGATISKGKVVYVTGHFGNSQITIGLANANSEATSADVIGVTAEDIADGASGYVQTFGYLTGIETNTSEIPTGQEGKALYLSGTTAGTMRIGLPTQPLHGVRVGFLLQRAGIGNGAMFVNVQNYQELEELSDVYITGIANNDILQWDNTDLRWENRSLATAGIAASAHTHTLSDITQSGASLNNVPQWNGTNWVPASVSATPGGSTGQIQYNNASSFAGATNVKINSNNLELVKPASEPTTAPADSVIMYAKSFGQRDLPAFVDASGWSTNLQTCIARNKFTQFNFVGNTNSAAINNGMVMTTTSVGTAGTAGGAVAPTTTSLLGGSRRQTYLTSTTAGSATGWRASVAQCWRGNGVGRGGFFCIWKFGIGDATIQSAATLFVGLNDSTAAPALVVTQNPITTTDNTMRNQVGLCLAGGSLVYQIAYRNGTAAATTISTGVTANLTDIIEFCLYCAPNDSTIYYYMKVYADSGSNTEIFGDIGTSNIPVNTTQFVPHMWRGNNLLSVACAVHALSFSIETPH